jgi:hypothetical protein
MNDTWARRAPWTGIVAAVLAVLSVVIGGVDPPSNDASAADVAKYWDDSAQIWSAVLAGLASIFVVFFAAALRSRLRAAESASNLVLVGGGLFALGVALFAGVAFTLADLAGSDKAVDPGALQALNALESDLFLPGVLGLCVFYISTGLAIFGSGALPRGWGWLSVVLGVLCIAGPAGFVAFILSVPWMLVTAILLMRSDSVAGAGHQENPIGAS